MLMINVRALLGVTFDLGGGLDLHVRLGGTTSRMWDFRAVFRSFLRYFGTIFRTGNLVLLAVYESRKILLAD